MNSRRLFLSLWLLSGCLFQLSMVLFCVNLVWFLLRILLVLISLLSYMLFLGFIFTTILQYAYQTFDLLII